ncbi:hypothetical protein ACFL0W_05155 [Nanoarchaeota archaeon]
MKHSRYKNLIKTKLNKKADLSMNTIVIAAIALIVLIVLVIIFSSKIGLFGEGVSQESSRISGEKCEIPGARTCVADADACDAKNGKLIASLDETCTAGLCCSY